MGDPQFDRLDQEFDAFAALLRRGRDIPAMVETLAERLSRALPEAVTMKRKGLRRRISGLTVELGDEHFRIEVKGAAAEAWVDHVVREVKVRSTELDVDDWLSRLSEALKEEATRSTTVRLALEEALRP